jgi:hypothetical protein
MSTAPAAWAGVTAVNDVALVTVTAVAAVPPSETDVSPATKAAPVSVIVVPPAAGPTEGDTSVTHGATLKVKPSASDADPPR